MCEINRRRFGFLLSSSFIATIYETARRGAGPGGIDTDLTATLERFRAKCEIPGMAALVLGKERIVAQGAVGLRKQGAPEPLMASDQFHLGSCTKAMTATLAAMLVDDGKLKWTTTLNDLFGDTLKGMRRAWKSVTLEQVLAHRASFPSGNDPDLLLDRHTAESTKSVQQLRHMLVASQLSQDPITPPGSKWGYSNVGYIVVGAALENITGSSWEDLMRERLFGPLGITSSGFGAPGTTGKVDQPWGHDEAGNPIDPGSPRSDNPMFFGPAGTVHMAIADWAKFIAVHLAGDSSNPHRRVSLLKAKTFDEIHRGRADESYSAGWALGNVEFAQGARSNDKGIVFGHEGSNG